MKRPSLHSFFQLMFLLTTSSYAETIIVPIRGDIVFGADASYITTVEVTNLDAKPVSVRRGQVFPALLQHPCSDVSAVVIQPLESADVPTGCIGLYAYTLETDGKVRVDAEVLTTRPVPLPVGFTSSSNWQQFETARAWLPSARLAVIPRVWIGGSFRTNLFVVNPNDQPINFELNTIRRSPSEPSQLTAYVLAPRSMSVISAPEIDDPVCRLPLVCGPTYRLTFRADAPYYAVSSSVLLLGDAVVGSPSVVDDPP